MSYLPETASSLSGVAEVRLGTHGDGLQVTVSPVSASGLATLEVRPVNGSSYEAVLDDAGNPINNVSLSSQFTRIIERGVFSHVRVTSSNTADTFTVSAL